MMKACVAWALLAMGCASPPETGLVEPGVLARGPEGEPLTTFVLRDGWAWPHRLAELEVAVDGEVVHQASFEPRVERPRVIERLSLPAGEHTLTVAAVAGFASTRMDGDDGCFVELRGSQRFEVGDDPVALELALWSRGPLARFDERVDMAIAVAGASRTGVSEVVRYPRRGPSHCLDDGPLPFSDGEIEDLQRWPDRYAPLEGSPALMKP